MAEIAREGSRDFNIRALAIEIVGEPLQKDYASEAKRLLKFVRDHIRYIRDTYSAEVLQYPQVTLGQNGGDCDDKCILLGALLASVGHAVRFIGMAQIADRFSHVWVQVNIDGKWVDLEPTEPIGYGRRVPDTGVETYLTQELGD